MESYASHQSANKDVNLNKAVDALLPHIRTLILKYGMDPMQLADFSKPIFPYLPEITQGNIDFKKGWMQNLSKIKRTNDVTATYKDKLLLLDMNFGFDVADFNYEYHLQHLLYTREGDVYGRFFDLEINTVVTINLANYELFLNSIKFYEIRKYDIKFEGNILDQILNVLVKLVTIVFRECILIDIENYAAVVFGRKIDEWNKIPRSTRIKLIEGWLNTSTS